MAAGPKVRDGVHISGTTAQRPTSASAGDTYYDSDTGELLVYSGSAWVDVAAGGSSIATTDIDAGASGTAGTVDIFPSTASKGKIALTAADSAGNTTTTIVNASQSGARTYTIPDAGASSSFVMAAGASTLSGAKTFTGGVVVTTAGVTITDVDVALGTTTGTKIGTATTQKLGFWNATPVVQPVGANQGAVGAVTTVGANTGTAGAGLSLIGDTTAVNQAAAIMNDMVALQEDISALQVLVNQLRGDLVTLGLIKGAA